MEYLTISLSQHERGWRKTQPLATRDLSVSIKEHGVMAAVDSSGSGKSLLAHAVMGLLPANVSWSGSTSFEGEELTQERVRKLRGSRMVLMPQSISYLNPLMKVGDQVRKGHRDEASGAHSKEVIGRYGLGEETEELYPFQLSGGMTRRILIPVAVMEKPELATVDEPTPGLYISMAKRVLLHFREVADEGVGVLLITHDLEPALEAVDRIVVFYVGTNVGETTVFDSERGEGLRHPYTKALLRAMPAHGFEAELSARSYVKDLPPDCPYRPGRPHMDPGCLEEIEYRSYRGGMVECRKAVP